MLGVCGTPVSRRLANVKNDEYAMISADDLGKRVVEMARIIKAGKEVLKKSS